MADLRTMRKRFAITSIVLAVIAALGALYLALPIGASNADLNADLKQSNKELDIKEKQVAPLRGLPEKLVKTNEDITRFYRDRLPERQSDVSEELGKLATAESVTLSDVKYENFDTEVPTLRAVVVEATLSGDYAKLAKFINAAERDKMFLMVDSLSLDDQKGGTVRLQLRFGTLLRPSNIASASPETTKEAESAAKPAKASVSKPAPKSVSKPVSKSVPDSTKKK